jgi:hypothetical protein
VAPVVECLLYKRKALSSNTSPTKHHHHHHHQKIVSFWNVGNLNVYVENSEGIYKIYLEVHEVKQVIFELSELCDLGCVEIVIFYLQTRKIIWQFEPQTLSWWISFIFNSSQQFK